MKKVVECDPETGYRLRNVNKSNRKMAAQYPTQLRIRDVPEDVIKRYEIAGALMCMVQLDLQKIFEGDKES